MVHLRKISFVELTSVALILACSVLTAFAQSETASIRGSVTDPNGAVIPNAVIRLFDTDRGSARTLETRSDGSYSLVGIRPGGYRIEIEKRGLKRSA